MGRVANARTAVAAALVADARTVIPYPRDVDQVQGPTVVLAVESVDPSPVACPAPLVTVNAWVVGPYTDPGPADDALDDALDAVLDDLDAAGLTWTSVERAVWRDRNPAYLVTVEVAP